jgi:rubrerythrin
MKMILLILFSLALFSFAQTKPQGMAQSQSQTLKNLQKAYQAEANATRKYEIFAKKAAEEKYAQVAELFRAISKSESIHMANHKAAIQKMGGKPAEVVYDKVEVRSTRENLRGPIGGEKKETEALYPAFVKTAKQENANQAVNSFTYAMEAEAQHEKLFEEALAQLGKNQPADYYVSNVTGSTIKVQPGGKAPQGTLPNEKFQKVE